MERLAADVCVLVNLSSSAQPVCVLPKSALITRDAWPCVRQLFKCGKHMLVLMVSQAMRTQCTADGPCGQRPLISRMHLAAQVHVLPLDR